MTSRYLGHNLGISPIALNDALPHRNAISNHLAQGRTSTPLRSAGIEYTHTMRCGGAADRARVTTPTPPPAIKRSAAIKYTERCGRELFARALRVSSAPKRKPLPASVAAGVQLVARVWLVEVRSHPSCGGESCRERARRVGVREATIWEPSAMVRMHGVGMLEPADAWGGFGPERSLL